LRGLRITERNLSQVKEHPEFRTEAEFYLASDGVQRNFVLGAQAIPFAQYGTSEELNEEEIGYPVLRLNEISNGFVETAEKHCAFLNDKDFRNLELKKNDVLICRTNGNPRFVGMTALVMEDTPVAFASYLYKVRPNRALITPATLLVFLNCAKGRMEIEKHSIRSNQVNFSPERLRQARLPLFTPDFQHHIDNQVEAAFKQRRLADKTYLDADRLLLCSLSLTNWSPPSPLTYIHKASEVFGVARFDAEHFQPKYKAMLEHARKQATRYRTIDEIAIHCDRGEQPEYTEDGTLAVVTSQHILETGLDYEVLERTAATNWDNPAFVSARIQQHDILTYTTGAKVGRTAAYLASDKALASNHVNLLRLREENPVYVATVMHSMIGRWQTNMWASGSAQVELYPQDIRRFVIPFVDSKTETVIVKSVQEAYEARRKAYALFDNAKHAVEIAIEESETAALKYIKTAMTEASA